MRFWKRSSRPAGRSDRETTSARAPGRKRRFQLENLEQRTLLSTYTISEIYTSGVPTVIETVGNVTTHYAKPASPFVVNTGSGSNLVNILNTSAHIGITLSGGGSSSVNLGNAGSVQGILGAVNVAGLAGSISLSINDSADATGRTVTLGTFSSGGAPWGSVTGLAPAAIDYKYADVSSVSVITGMGADTVNVHATGPRTTVSTSGAFDTVNVGNAGSVQAILGVLDVENPPNLTALNVNDSADATGRTVKLASFTSAGASWGSITGLAPAAINYKYGDISSVSVTTGLRNDTVDILATGRPTTVSTSGGIDTVNVGNAGSVQGIAGALNIENPDGITTINVDDSADVTRRTVTLGAFTPSGESLPWGSITGLAPAAINYPYLDISSLTITAGVAADTVNVLATLTQTTISSSLGYDTVNVGNAGSVQGIRGALYVENPPSYTSVNVDDSADPTARTVTLGELFSGGTPWGTITGLAPAAINYRYANTAAVFITTGLGADTVNVRATGVTTTLSSSGYYVDDTVNVGDAGGVQDIKGVLDIENPPSFTVLNVDDSADPAARTVALETTGGWWGEIVGLSPMPIYYDYNDTASVTITTGSAHNTVNVLATGVTTTISSNGGFATVNVGNAGNVQSIQRALDIENPHSYTTINVDDFSDPTQRTVTLGTYTSGGLPWGTITGLAPGPINYLYADTQNLDIITGRVEDNFNVLATGSGVTTTLLPDGSDDAVSVGNAGSVQGILGALFIENQQGFTALYVDDSADPTPRTATLGTYYPDGAAWGLITGLAPAPIAYYYASTGSVAISTGRGADTVNVLATGSLTTVTSGGYYVDDTVNVGNAGSVQDILGELFIENPPSFTTVNVDDSADPTARTVTLDTLSGSSPFGEIIGLAPATINYKYADTLSVTITTGTAADTVNVLATGVTTTLSSSGHYDDDTVNVGNAGSLQGILGVLNIENPPSYTVLNIEDWADPTARTVVLGADTSGGSDWGSITNLAPVAINYNYGDVAAVNISTPGAEIFSWLVFADARATSTGVVVTDNGNEVN